MELTLQQRQRVYHVISSCITKEQVNSAKQYVFLFLRLHNIGTDEKLAKSLLKNCNYQMLKLRSKQRK